MKAALDDARGAGWLPLWLLGHPERAVFLFSGLGLAIRLYLSLTSFCISGDGLAYLAMARDYAAGEPAKALASVFSPLYPLLIALIHPLVPDWELAGELVSTFFGTATVALAYGLVLEAHRRRDLAIGAAALTAIHPGLTAYSASVRTEAGYICLMVASALLVVRGLNGARVREVAAGGLVGGLAYLYRTEGIGLPVVVAFIVPAAAFFWRRPTVSTALRATLLFIAGFMLVAAPYLVYLRLSTGHWSVGRELAAAMMYGMAQASPHPQTWMSLAWSGRVSPLAGVFGSPRIYLTKVAGDLFKSLYGMGQALGPVLSLFLVIGLWQGRRAIAERPAQAFIASLVLFYFIGFTLSITGSRFMAHVIVFTFGWTMLGLAAVAQATADAFPAAPRVAALAPSAVLAIGLIPITLWPIGYDMRGVRYAGAEIARRGPAGSGIVTNDGRVAFYAGGRAIAPPKDRQADLCRWLVERRDAQYVMLSGREEEKLGLSEGAPCLVRIRRYARTGTGYYDLFEIRHRSDHAVTSLGGRARSH